MDRVEEYIQALYLQEHLSYIEEVDLKAVLKKLTPEVKTKKMITDIGKKIDKKNPEKTIKDIKNITSMLSKVKLTSVDSFVSSKTKNYTSDKKNSKLILKNSLPKVSDKVLDYASSFMALTATVQKKNEKIQPKALLNKNIKNFVMKVRSFHQEYYGDTTADEEKKKDKSIIFEHTYDLAVGFSLVALMTSFGYGLLKGMLVIGGAIGGTVTAIGGTVTAIGGAVTSWMPLIAIIIGLIILGGLLGTISKHMG